LNKLRAIFQIGLIDWLDVDFSRWGSVAKIENRMFRQLKQAIFENREITFDYNNATGESGKRNVYPYKLVYKDKAWYLYAFCLLRNENRLFRFSYKIYCKRVSISQMPSKLQRQTMLLIEEVLKTVCLI
jgi:predicted DNA-binding transcriptional regulator YafY